MNKMKGEKDKNMRNKGITLIALVITIIVLLILAAVSIATLTGENGILTRANDAKEQTEIAEEKEAIQLAYAGAVAEKRGTGDVTASDLNTEFETNGTNATAVDNGDGTITVTFDSGRSYTIDADGKISDPTISNIVATMEIVGDEKTEEEVINDIPDGFYYVEGTHIDTGLVISSVDEDDLNNSAEGNQFVWVPVDKNQRIEINVTSKEENITSITLTDPYGDPMTLPNSDNLGTSYKESVEPTINGPYVLNVSTATEEKTVTLGVHTLYASDTMMDWVLTEEYAESIGETLEDLLSELGCTTKEEAYLILGAQYKTRYQEQDGEVGLNHRELVEKSGGFYIGRYEASYYDGKVSSKKSESTNRASSSDTLENGMLWNYVSQIEALEKSKELYTGISTLLTGAAWDRTLGWLEETGAVTSFEIVGDSKTWGNYRDDEFSNTTSLINTGEYDETKRNNIYDLAGNLGEWTTEAYSTSDRVSRSR